MKHQREETRILNREIRGIHEKGQGTGDSLKGVSREIFTEMIDSEILHCDGRGDSESFVFSALIASRRLIGRPEFGCGPAGLRIV